MVPNCPTSRAALAAAAIALLWAAPSTAQPQISGATGGLQMNREELEARAQELEAAAASPAYSGRTSDRARQEATYIRERLTQGDLRVGDRVLLTIEGELVPDTIPVRSGPTITLPVYGEISLRGVLRSELEDHLTQEIGRFLLDPVVRAQALIRVSIQGRGVGGPGFFTLPAEMLVEEALMRAGGPLGTSDLEDIEIRRGDALLWSGIEVRDALVEGRTLDQMNLRGGDEIRVTVIPESSWWRTALSYGLPIATSLLLGVRVFGGF